MWGLCDVVSDGGVGLKLWGLGDVVCDGGVVFWQVLTMGHTGKGACTCKIPSPESYWRVEPKCAAAGHSESVESLTFSPNGKWVVSGSRDKLVKIWDAYTGAEVRSFVGVR